MAEAEAHRNKITNLIVALNNKLQNGNRVKLDFSRVKKVYPGGMLYLLSHLEWLCELYPRRIKATVTPRSVVSKLLVQFGMAARMNINPDMSKPTAESVVQWQYRTGTEADGSPVRAALQEYRQKTTWSIPDDLYAVISEGIDNVADHAYKLDEELPPKWKRWWMFAGLQEPSPTEVGGLYVALYDFGNGIPETMRLKLILKEYVLDVYDNVKRVFTMNGTALEKRLLGHAIERRRSSTGQDHRGRGLPEMKKFIENTPDGQMYVVSGLAEYRYTHGASQGQVKGCEQMFPGTLVLWSIPLTPSEDI
ncbi:hypothetical protein M5C99_15365 [Acidovorax sp. NCPPB 2350]|nr:hypothetical protein M5C99_15365 [Acidovorax sp. NCPPB 2350]